MSVPRYLQAGFDPMTIKMDSIREILIHYKVKPPTGEVRKQDLVDLFELHIRPRAAELRKPYERAIPAPEPVIKAPATTRLQPRERPQALLEPLSQPPATLHLTGLPSTTMHIVQPTRQDKATTLSSSTSSMSSSTSSKRREAKTNAVAKPIYTDEEDETKPRQRRKVVDEGTDMDSSSTSNSIRGRKSQKSTARKGDGPELALERRSPRKKKSEGSRKQRAMVSENFSDENPFQSGSESERKRRSKTRDSVGSSRNSSTVRNWRRKSHDDETRLDREHVFKVPAQPAFSKYMATPKYTAGSTAFDRAEFDSGPFHNSPLSAKTKRMSIPTLPPPSPRIIQFESAANTYGTRSKRGRGNDGPNLGPLKLILLMALLSYGLWYRQTRIDIGFCTPSTFIPTQPSNDPLTAKQWLLKWIYPTCIPCPDHATCTSSKSDPLCPPEYILRPHPLSFGSLIPLTPICVLNKAQEYQSLQVADAAENILHKRAGQEECRSSTRPQPTAELLSRQRLSIPELKNEIESLKDVSVSQEEFNQYWDLALSELYRRSATIIIEQGIGERYLRSAKPARPIFCRVRQGVLGWIEQFKEILIALLALAIGGLQTRNYILNRREESRIVHGLVEEALSKLSEQADSHVIDPMHYCHSFVPQIHLRDVLLAHIHSPLRRQEIWEKVSMIVDRNANVRVSAEEVHGEIYRVWEWIGASGVLSQKKSLGASGRLGSSTSSNGSGFGGAQAMFDNINDRMLSDTEQSPLYPSLS